MIFWNCCPTTNWPRTECVTFFSQNHSTLLYTVQYSILVHIKGRVRYFLYKNSNKFIYIHICIIQYTCTPCHPEMMVVRRHLAEFHPLLLYTSLNQLVMYLRLAECNCLSDISWPGVGGRPEHLHP